MIKEKKISGKEKKYSKKNTFQLKDQLLVLPKSWS